MNSLMAIHVGSEEGVKFERGIRKASVGLLGSDVQWTIDVGNGQFISCIGNLEAQVMSMDEDVEVGEGRCWKRCESSIVCACRRSGMAVKEDNEAKRPDIRRRGIGTRRRLDLEKKIDNRKHFLRGV